MKKFIGTLFIMFLAITVVKAQTADEIVNNYLNALGGSAKLESVKSRKVDIVMTTSGIQLPGVIYEDNKNRQKLELTYQGMKIINSYDGETAWAQSPPAGMPQPTKLSGAEAEAFTNNEFLNEFINWKSRGMKVELKAEESLDGKSYYRIDLTTPKGKLTKYFIDKETYLVEATKEISPSLGQEVTSYLSDYKEFNGIKMPTQVSVKVGGTVVQAIKVNAVEHNVVIPDSVYAFPGN